MAALIMLGAAAPAAGAVTFGPDLSAPVAAGAPSCGALGQPSCLGYNVIPTSYAPQSGVVTAVRVKVGAVTGPMQVVVMRSYYQNNPNSPGHPNYFCCFLQTYGPAFTPRANAVTTVPAALGMVEELAPPAGDFNTVAKDDFLALSILNSTTPVPLAQGAGGQGLASYYAPAPQAPNNPPAPSANGLSGSLGAGTVGYYLLMNADLDTGGGGPPLSIPGTGALTATTARVPLVCRVSTICRGTLTLQDRAGRTASAAARAHVLGASRYTIRPGHRATIKVALNRTGRTFVKGHRRVTVYATTTLGSKRVSLKLTLKR